MRFYLLRIHECILYWKIWCRSKYFLMRITSWIQLFKLLCCDSHHLNQYIVMFAICIVLNTLKSYTYISWLNLIYNLCPDFVFNYFLYFLPIYFLFCFFIFWDKSWQTLEETRNTWQEIRLSILKKENRKKKKKKQKIVRKEYIVD